MSVECMRYKSVHKGTLLGYADLYIPKTGLEIYGCSLYQKDGKRWINFPSKEYQDEVGQKKFAPMLRFRDKAHMEGFTKIAKEAIEKKCAEMGQSFQEPSYQDEEVPF